MTNPELRSGGMGGGSDRKPPEYHLPQDQKLRIITITAQGMKVEEQKDKPVQPPTPNH